MRSAAAGLIALLIALAQPAQACSPSPGWPRTVKLDIPETARTLVAAAAAVDVVVAERMTDDFEVGVDPQANAWAMENYVAHEPDKVLTAAEVSARLKTEIDEGVRVHYRVVETLKGDGPSTFSLNGAGSPPDPRQTYRRPRPTTLEELRARLDSQDFAEWQGFGACIQPLWSEVGHHYLVFRDAQGRLLHHVVPATLQGRHILPRGPVYAEIWGTDDAWLAAVRHAIAGR